MTSRSIILVVVGTSANLNQPYPIGVFKVKKLEKT